LQNNSGVGLPPLPCRKLSPFTDFICMKAPLHLLPVAALLALPATLHAQNELSNFTATGRGGVINTFASDYQVIGINPANLGRAGEYTVAFTVGEVGVGVASASLSKTIFKKIIGSDTEALTPAQRSELVTQLTSDNALNLNTDITTFGISVNLPSGLGGIAFSNRQRLGAHLALNGNAADIIVNGRDAAIVQQYYPGNLSGTTPPTNPNAPQLTKVLDGSAIQLSWTNEYNFAYGNRVIDKATYNLSVGAGYRYIQGIGIADIRISDGNFYGYNALAPVFKVNYGSIATNSNFNLRDGSKLETVGTGHGFDLGVAAEIGKALRLGVSVTDIGTMTWDGNVLTATDQPLKYIDADKLESYDVINGIGDLFDNSSKALFTYQASQERKSSLPTKLRLGGGFRISELFEVGLDITAPLNKVAGNLTSPFVGAGVDFKPTRWLRLSTGVTGGAGYGASLPLGVTFVSPIWEAGISSRDITGYFNEKAPYYSVGLGFLRFKLGGKN
jgi:hypothetical protein